MRYFIPLLAILCAPCLWAQTARTISTVAGNGTMGFTGDGGRASSAEIGSVDVIAHAAIGGVSSPSGMVLAVHN